MSIGRLTWRREPHETGLARVTQGPRGADLMWRRPDGVREVVGHVAAVRVGWSHDWRGWYWYARSERDEVALRNTHSEKHHATIDKAKAQCLAYVRAELAKVQP